MLLISLLSLPNITFQFSTFISSFYIGKDLVCRSPHYARITPVSFQILNIETESCYYVSYTGALTDGKPILLHLRIC